MSLYPSSIVCSKCDGPMVHSRLSSRCRCNDKEPRFQVGDNIKVKDRKSFYFDKVAEVVELSNFTTADHFRIYTVKVNGNITFAIDEFNMHYHFGD